MVIAIDQDPDAIARAQDQLKNYILNGTCEIIQTNFRNIKNALMTSSQLIKNRCIESNMNTDGIQGGLVDGILMDLGISSFQIDEPSR